MSKPFIDFLEFFEGLFSSEPLEVNAVLCGTG